MKSCNRSFFFAALIAVVFFSSSANATKHIITFNSVTFSYIPPLILNVQVGDTMEWQGNFGNHPLITDTVPSQAAQISETSTSVQVYDYVVKVPGRYVYECANHGPRAGNGGMMLGAFQAGTSGVENTLAYATDIQISPNPASSSSRIAFQLSQPGEVAIRLLDDRGAVVKEVTSKRYAVGNHKLNVDISSLANGAYFYQFRVDGNVSMKPFVVNR
jgi:plastocyanin